MTTTETTARNWHPITREEAAPIYAKVPSGHIDNASPLEAAFFIHAHAKTAARHHAYIVTTTETTRKGNTFHARETWGTADAAIYDLRWRAMFNPGTVRHAVTVA